MAKADVAFSVAALFLAGVLLSSLGFPFYFILLLVFFACLARFFIRRFSISISQIAILASALAIGFLYYQLSLNLKNENQNLPFGTRVSFEAIIVNEPRATEKSQQFTVRALPPLAGNVYVITSLIPGFTYGDKLLLDGHIEPTQSAVADPVIFLPSITLIDSHAGNRIKEYLLDFKYALVAEFKQSLPQQAAALLAGITLGARSDFSPEFKNQMALSGTTHIVALSGYNITILVVAVAAVFGRWLSRRKTFFITTILIILFVLMAGAEASAIRAAIMGFLALLAREAGRIYSFRNAVAFAAAGMVLVNPTILVFDIGFQLSFLSLLGIVYAAPAIRNAFHMRADEESIFGWRENLVTTLGAQLAVMPILLNSFGQFSLTSFAANILILAFMPLTMLLGFLLAGVGLLFHSLAFLFAWAAYPVLAYEIWVIQLFSAARISVLNTTFSWATLVFFYVLFVGFILKRKLMTDNTYNK